MWPVRGVLAANGKISAPDCLGALSAKQGGNKLKDGTPWLCAQALPRARNTSAAEKKGDPLRKNICKQNQALGPALDGGPSS